MVFEMTITSFNLLIESNVKASQLSVSTCKARLHVQLTQSRMDPVSGRWEVLQPQLLCQHPTYRSWSHRLTINPPVTATSACRLLFLQDIQLQQLLLSCNPASCTESHWNQTLVGILLLRRLSLKDDTSSSQVYLSRTQFSAYYPSRSPP